METREREQSGWSWRIGTALGIPIRVHFTFLLLVVWFAVRGARQGQNIALAVAFLLLVFGCVLLHELGHAAMARRFGVRTRDIVLYPIGGLARLENIPAGRAELWIALAGPLVNLLLAVVLFLVLLATGLLGIPPQQLTAPSDLLVYLFGANMVLFLFNLLPAFPMDGGRILRAVLSIVYSQERATEVATTIGQGFAILFGIAGIVLPEPLLLLIAFFVFIGASQEAAMQRQQTAFMGKTVGVAMITRFETLAPQDSLAHAADLLLATHQQDFPVLDAWGRVAGVLPRAHLLRHLAQSGSQAGVLDAMERSAPIVSPSDDLNGALILMRANPSCPLLVVEDERLVGMLTLENLTEYIEVASRKEPAAAPER